MAALSLEPWQWGALGLAWLALFALPAVWMARRARRDGDEPALWAILVLVGSFLGILEYFHHRSILRRRARREERAKRSAAEDGERATDRRPD